MKPEINVLMNNSKVIATNLYIDWMHAVEIYDYFKQPTSLPVVIYEKRWPQSIEETIERIFQFLSTVKLFIEANGTYILNENHMLICKSIKDKVSRLDLKIDPNYHFIQYGLKLLDDIIDGGSGLWNNTILIEQLFASTLYIQCLRN